MSQWPVALHRVETVCNCHVVLDRNYMNELEMLKMNEQAGIVWKKVNNFISYLSKSWKTPQSPKENQ